MNAEILVCNRLADNSVQFDQSINWQPKLESKTTMPRFEKNVADIFLIVVSVQSVQFFLFFLQISLFVSLPPVNVWHTAILSNTNVVILCCCICVYWAMAVLFSDRFGYKLSLNYTSVKC